MGHIRVAFIEVIGSMDIVWKKDEIFGEIPGSTGNERDDKQ